MTEIDYSLLKEYAVTLVAQCIEQREEKRHAPFLATLEELHSRVKEDLTQQLRLLCRERLLTCHKDINGNVMFEFTKPK